MHFEATLKNGQSKIYFTTNMLSGEGLGEESLDDLTQLSLKWASFDPQPLTSQQVSFMVGPVGFENGTKLPLEFVSSKDPDSFSRVFFMQKRLADKNVRTIETESVSTLTRYLSIPMNLNLKPSQVPIFSFMVPQSALEVP